MYNPERVTYFGATDSRGQRVPFGLKAKDRNRHMYVIGKTGMGKSTLLENMAIQDIQNGEGMAFIDPHGSAIEELLEFIPKDRIGDVVYFAPFDMENPIAFNVMEDVGYDKRHLVTSGLMATFKKIWQDAWSARMEYILTNTLLALLEYPGATLLGVNRMYSDKAYRAKVVDNIKDPVIKDFWAKEYASYSDKFAQEATAAIQNKIGQFTSNPLIRNIIGQPKSSFDIREIMDGRKILLVNLSKGLVGDVNMRLIGSMITTRIFLAAMSRAELAPATLKSAPPFYFYVDEFQNFANETFAEILSEARKYNLNLIMAHQYVEQMEEPVRAAVFGNVGTLVAFRVGPLDAEVLEPMFSPEFMKEDLVNLGFTQIYLSLMIDGVGSRPFSATGIPPIEAPPVSYRQEVIEASRKKFAVPRAGIEKQIFDELLPPEPEARPRPKLPESNRPRLTAGDDRPRERRAPSASGQGGSQQREPRQEQQSEQPRERQSERSDRPQERRREDHPREDRPAPEKRREAPPQEGKSLEDLRSILRDMTSSAQATQSSKKQDHTEGLKGALSQVAKPETPQPATPAPKPQERPQTAQQDATAPYEVPEQTLRDLFKE